MNFQDKLNDPGLDALRRESAPTGLHRTVIDRLQARPEVPRRGRTLQFSLATAIALGIMGVLLVPRPAMARVMIAKVAKAFQSASRYHVKSYQVDGSQRKLMTETWVDGSQRKVVSYDEAGKPHDTSEVSNQISAQVTDYFKHLSPEQILKLSGGTASVDLGVLPNDANKVVLGGLPSGVTATKIIVNGKEVKQIPDDVKKQIEQASAGNSNVVVSVGDDTNLDHLRELLKQTAIWDVKPDERFNGQTVEKFSIKGAPSSMTLFVDPATSLPVAMRVSAGSWTFEDDFDYTTVKP